MKNIKILRVGDPHANTRNLKDMEALISFVELHAKENDVDRIEFMGDNFHTHAVMRMEVVDFWRRAFNQLKQFNVLTLIGNHDQPGSREKEGEMSALDSFKHMSVTVVDRPMILNNIAYISHTGDRRKLVAASKNMFESGATKCLVAHQNFTVKLFSDYVEQDLIMQEQIISGHIHNFSQVGKCLNIGTPKWDTLTDANEKKGIWIFEHNVDGSVASKEFISTEGVVTPIMKFTINEGERVPELNEKANNYLELVGTSAWISEIKKKYKGVASIKARPTDKKRIKNINKSISLFEYLDTSFNLIDGVESSDVKKYFDKL